MISDLLLILGLILLTVAAFMAGVVAGLAVCGLALVLLSIAYIDGKGLSWRS